jgi:hypothetical protein
MLNVFIVRPFGTKEGIDFDRAEAELIRPAMEQAGLKGGTTGEFIQQGNIRADMFEQLLIADLVIADISIHNANVFYELGIRHGLRDKRTFLIKARQEPASAQSDVPFDLKTDRYLSYDAKNPAGAVDLLAAALTITLDAQRVDSPVYQLLPALEPADPAKVLVVPFDFRQEVDRAEAARNCGELQMLAAEIDGFTWRAAGLRIVGRAQFRSKDWPGARATWQTVRDYDDTDVEANTLLGTIFQRLGDLVSSDQAVERALQNKNISAWDRAEIQALMGRNAKTQWEQAWSTLSEPDGIRTAALASPFLEKSLALYTRGFAEDRNHFYSGLNALAMVTMMSELAKAQPAAWQEGFDSTADADRKLQQLSELRTDLAAAVKLALESKHAALARAGRTDFWVEISTADLICLTSSRPSRVGQAFKKALAASSDQAREAVRRQMALYRRLGILSENIQAALENIAPSSQLASAETSRVIVFTGHRIDAPNRKSARFPAAKESQARDLICAALAEEKKRGDGPLLGISGGASGGDILFHEACEKLGIPSQLFLALPKGDYIKSSVAESGADWVGRFDRLYDRGPTRILSDSEQLPRWLRAKKNYSIWQRSNLWMLHNALFLSRDHLTLIALWNGAAGDGPGGTEDMVRRAQNRGARFIHLDTRKLFE